MRPKKPSQTGQLTTLTGVRWVRSGIIFTPLFPNDEDAVEDLLFEAMPFPLVPDVPVTALAACFCTAAAVAA